MTLFKKNFDLFGFFRLTMVVDGDEAVILIPIGISDNNSDFWVLLAFLLLHNTKCREIYHGVLTRKLLPLQPSSTRALLYSQ